MRRSDAQKVSDDEIRPLLKTDFVEIDYLGRRALPAFVASDAEDKHKRVIKRKRADAVLRILAKNYSSFDPDEKSAWEVIQADVAKSASLWTGTLVQLLTRRFQQAEFDAFFATCLPKISLKKLLLVFELANAPTRELLIDRVVETPKGINTFALNSMMNTRDILPLVIAGLARNPSSTTAQLLFRSQFIACNRESDFERAWRQADEGARSIWLNTLGALTAEHGGETSSIVVMFPGGSKYATAEFGDGRVGGRGPDVEIDDGFEHIVSISAGDIGGALGEKARTTSLYGRGGSVACHDIKVIQHDTQIPNDGKAIAFLTVSVPTAIFSVGGDATIRAARSIVAGLPGYCGADPIWLFDRVTDPKGFVMQLDASFGLDSGGDGFVYVFEDHCVQRTVRRESQSS